MHIIVLNQITTYAHVFLYKVSSVSNLLPDALQKWHVTSKSLEQNQSNIYNKLSEMHKSLTSFEKEVNIQRFFDFNQLLMFLPTIR